MYLLIIRPQNKEVAGSGSGLMKAIIARADAGCVHYDANKESAGSIVRGIRGVTKWNNYEPRVFVVIDCTRKRICDRLTDAYIKEFGCWHYITVSLVADRTKRVRKAQFVVDDSDNAYNDMKTEMKIAGEKSQDYTCRAFLGALEFVELMTDGSKKKNGTEKDKDRLEDFNGQFGWVRKSWAGKRYLFGNS